MAALFFMDLDWAQCGRGSFAFLRPSASCVRWTSSQIDVTFTSLFESIAVAILSTVYSLVGGMVLAVFLAKT